MSRGVLDAEVAGAEPAIRRERRRRLLGLLVVAARDDLAAELELALLARPARRAGLRVHDAHREPGRRVDARELPELERLLPLVGEGHAAHPGPPVGGLARLPARIPAPRPAAALRRPPPRAQTA